MEPYVKEERFLLLLSHFKKFSSQFFDECNVPPYYIHWVVFLRVGEWERVDVVGAHVFLANNSAPEMISVVEDPWEALNSVKRVEVVVGLVEAVHPVLVLREACKNGGAARGAATDGRVRAVEDDGLLPELVQVRRLALVVAVDRRLEASVVGHHQEDISVFFGSGPWVRTATQFLAGAGGLGVRRPAEKDAQEQR